MEDATSTTAAASAAVPAAEAAESTPIDVDDLPSDSEAPVAGPATKSGKGASATKDGKESSSAEGLDAYVLPKSKITKIAKTAIPANTKLQKEVPIALTRSSVVFISYLTSLAQEQAASNNVKTIKPEHVLDALDELDWGEADTARLRKDLKKQLKAFRANAQAKKEGRPPPVASTSTGSGTGRGRGRPKKQKATEDEVNDSDIEELTAPLQKPPKSTLANQGTDAEVDGSEQEDSADDQEAEGDDADMTKDSDEATLLRDDRNPDTDGDESPIEEGEDEEEQDEEDEDEEDDDIEDADEEDANPEDYEDEMGRGLDDGAAARRGTHQEDDD